MKQRKVIAICAGSRGSVYNEPRRRLDVEEWKTMDHWRSWERLPSIPDGFDEPKPPSSGPVGGP